MNDCAARVAYSQPTGARLRKIEMDATLQRVPLMLSAPAACAQGMLGGREAHRHRAAHPIRRDHAVLYTRPATFQRGAHVAQEQTGEVASADAETSRELLHRLGVQGTVLNEP
jgi:hypothetical protein